MALGRTYLLVLVGWRTKWQQP